MAQSSSLINSAGLWLIPPLQRTNSIPAGAARPMTIVSWPAPDGSRTAVGPDGRDRRLEPSDDRRVADIGRRLVDRRQLGLTSRRARDRLHRRGDVGDGAAARLVARRAQVDREARQAGNDVDRARLDVQPADGGDEFVLGARARLDRQHHLGGGGERVAAQIHRRRAGVAGQPPSTTAPSRVAPLIALTTPSGHPSASSTGPCSMCSSTNAATPSARAAPRWSGSPPNALSASRIDTPSASFCVQRARGSSTPTRPREPVNV